MKLVFFIILLGRISREVSSLFQFYTILQEFETWLQGVDRCTAPPTYQESTVTPDATETKVTVMQTSALTTRSTSFADTDIDVLTRHYGELKPGMTITIGLTEACELLGRTRKRIDAFKRLQDHLKAEYEVELVITSRKTHYGKD